MSEVPPREKSDLLDEIEVLKNALSDMTIERNRYRLRCGIILSDGK